MLCTLCVLHIKTILASIQKMNHTSRKLLKHFCTEYTIQFVNKARFPTPLISSNPLLVPLHSTNSITSRKKRRRLINDLSGRIFLDIKNRFSNMLLKVFSLLLRTVLKK